MKPTYSPTFYYVEMDQGVYDTIRKGCKLLSDIMGGDLSELIAIARTAYEKRNGEPMPVEDIISISEKIKDIESIGWGSKKWRRLSTDSCTYDDIFEVLDRQQTILGKEGDTFADPAHYNKDISLIRFIDVLDIKTRRKKQLKIFCEDYSNRRRI